MIMMKDNFQYDIFLSHSAKDKRVVLALVNRLEQDGLRVWVYEREIKNGPIPTQIEAGLGASQLLLVAVSKNGEGSRWMKLERDVFISPDPMNEQKRIVVIRLDKTKPSGILSVFGYFDWIKKSKKEYSELSELLKELTIGKTYGLDHATIARVYDYFLGGICNTAADRAVANSLQKKYPNFKKVVISNRAFLRRAVRYLAEAGIKQFVDIGSGLPTQGNTHEIAQEICPNARVVYVDYDKLVVETSRRLLKQEPNQHVRVVLGDLKKPHSILHSDGMRIIDFRKPVALLLVAVVHFIIDDNIARKSVQTLRQQLAIGSYIAISHASRSKELGAVAKPMGKVYGQKVADIKQRQKKEVFELFDGITLVEPGLVFTPSWHPEIKDSYVKTSQLPFVNEPYRSLILAGVGVVVRKK